MFFQIFVFTVLQAITFVVGLTQTACDGTNITLTCPNGQSLNIVEAFYGRNSLLICPPQDAGNQSVVCSANDANYVVSRSCDGQQNCTLTANSTDFDDPCPETVKYLTVDYECVNVAPGPCGINQHRESCATACPRKCNDTGPINCTLNCIPNGCVCNYGHVRDPYTNTCISRHYCPLAGNPSDNHEVFSNCSANCGPTCKRQWVSWTCRPPFSIIERRCVPGYVCEKGYVRNQRNRECVLPRDCPPCRKWPF